MNQSNISLPNSKAPTGPNADPYPDLEWNPEAVQRLITMVYGRGEIPSVLCLGRREAAALKNYLAKIFDDGAVPNLKNQVYSGLKVVELRVDSLLRVETLRPELSDGRHAEQLKIRQAMEQHRIYSSAPIRHGKRMPAKSRSE